jgi:hypothetical protein
MALRPVNRDPVHGVALLRDPDRIEAAVADRDRDRTRLVDGAGGP